MLTCSQALTVLTGSCCSVLLPGAGSETVPNLANSVAKVPPEPCSSPASHCALKDLLSVPVSVQSACVQSASHISFYYPGAGLCFTSRKLPIMPDPPTCSQLLICVDSSEVHDGTGRSQCCPEECNSFLGRPHELNLGGIAAMSVCRRKH